MVKPSVKAIFCDLGNVVLRFKNRTDRLWELARLANPAKFGIPGSPLQSPEPYNAFMLALGNENILDTYEPGENAAWKLDSGKTPQREIYRGFLFATGCDEDKFPPERFWMAYSADLVAIHPVCDLLKEIQRRGTPLIAATNGETWTCDIVYRQTGLQFNGAVMSWQVGHKKPDEEFFSACLECARQATDDPSLSYGNCLFIDDISAYCTAFRTLGGHAIEFKASTGWHETLLVQVSDLRRELSGYGLLG